MPKAKATTPAKNLTRAEAVAAVYSLLCRGLDRRTIQRFADEKKWKRSEAQIDELITEATDQLVEAAAVNLDSEMGKAIERLTMIFQECLKIQDHKTALATQKEINRLLILRAAPAKPKALPQPRAASPTLRIVRSG